MELDVPNAKIKGSALLLRLRDPEDQVVQFLQIAATVMVPLEMVLALAISTGDTTSRSMEGA